MPTAVTCSGTLVPMRSVPHRVVVLLGLDDEVFPRSTRYSGDDVLGRCLALQRQGEPGFSDEQKKTADAMMAAALKLGGLHVVVNNAGITRDNLVDRVGADEVRSVIDNNLCATVHFCRAVLPHLLARGGGTVLALGEMGIGNTASAALLAHKVAGLGLDALVGRGALKLDHALNLWPVVVEGRTVLDVGASTGGWYQPGRWPKGSKRARRRASAS